MGGGSNRTTKRTRVFEIWTLIYIYQLAIRNGKPRDKFQYYDFVTGVYDKRQYRKKEKEQMQMFKAERIVIHPSFDWTAVYKDIALVK